MKTIVILLIIIGIVPLHMAIKKSRKPSNLGVIHGKLYTYSKYRTQDKISR